MRAKWAAMLTFENPINSQSAIGLALGALCGMAGTFVTPPAHPFRSCSMSTARQP
jgi:hypothetical protein